MKRNSNIQPVLNTESAVRRNQFYGAARRDPLNLSTDMAQMPVPRTTKNLDQSSRDNMLKKIESGSMRINDTTNKMLDRSLLNMIDRSGKRMDSQNK